MREAQFVNYSEDPDFGVATISNTTFANNTAGASAGALYNFSGATLTVSDSTFSGNLPADGGSIANGGTLTITDSVFVEPSSDSSECTTMPPATQCPANPSSPDANGNFDGLNTSFLLSSLGYYGGLTQTLVPLAGSPLICGSAKTGAKDVFGNPLVADQRGFGLDPSCSASFVDAGSVQANYLTVTTTADPGSGTCSTTCALRDAITKANTAGFGDIDFANGVTGTITLQSSLPDISGVVNIVGPGASQLTISGANTYRVIYNDGTLSLTGLEIANGNSALSTSPSGSAGSGGAILNAGNLALESTTLANNSAGTSGHGGAIRNTGPSLTVDSSTFSGNAAGSSGNGGAIENEGPLTITNSTFSTNTANSGSAIYNNSAGQISAEYSTFSGNNAASASSAAIYNNGASLIAANDTLSGNTNGGIFSSGSTLIVTNTILAEASECIGGDCPVSGGGNVYAGAGLTLAALGNYGGPTQTLLPLPGSSVICAGSASLISPAITSDQRGFSNKNTSYTGYSATTPCVDAGAVQTSYTAATFNDTSYTGTVNVAGTAPSVIVSLTENAQNIGGVPLTLQFTGTGTATGNTATTVAGVGATFSNLSVNSTGTDSISVSIPVVIGTMPTTLAAGPETLTISSGGAATTTVESAPSPVSFTYSLSSQTVTLAATVKFTVGGAPVNTGQVLFTVSGTGGTVGTPLSSPVNSSGQAGVVYSLPGGTQAGTYTITASYTDPGGNSPSSDSSQTFPINQATPVLTVTNSPVIYTGSAQAAAVSSGAVGGTVSSVLYSGSATVPTNAATYAITANFTPTDTTDYKTLTAASAGNFIIGQATPVLTVTNTPVTYNGSAQAAAVSSGAVTGTVSSVLYGGSATVPTHAGTYAITANFTSSNPNYTNLTAASAGNFVISQATPVLSVTNSPLTYNGSPQAAALTATVSGIGTVAGAFTIVEYGGSGTVPTNAATYAMTATFTPTDTTDYKTLTAASAGNFVIGQATPVLTVTNSPVTYNGSAQAATVSSGAVGGTISSVLYNGLGTVPTNAATYAITANFTPTDTTDYKTLTAASAGNFVIGQATPVLTVTNSPVTYNGSGQTATVSSGAVGGTVSTVLYNGSATLPIHPATYAITANFTPTDTTDYKTLTAASAGNFVINQATPVLTVTNSPVTYNGSAQSATVSSGAVGGTVSSVLYNGLGTVPTSAATYAITANFTPTDTTDYKTLTAASAGNFVIGQATPVLTVTNTPVTYNGSGQTATVSSGAVGGTVSSVLYNGSATLPIHPATYAITANFTPTDTTDYKTLTAASAGNFVINQATPVLTVTNSPVTYNGSAQSATVSSGAVTGSISNVLYNGLATAPTNAATYAITANFTPTDTTDYATVTAASAGNFVIGQATPVLTVTNSPVTYNGSGQTATVSSGAVGGTVSTVLYNGSATLPIHPATYAITANFTPTDTTDYKTLTAASAGNFVINQATPVLTVTNSPVTYNGSAQSATVSSGAVGGTVSSVLYNGLGTVPTSAATYAITANFTPTDTTDYKTLTAASAGNFVIGQATPVLTVTNTPVTYNGSGQTATVSSGAVGGTVSSVLYNGSATLPIHPATYAITANFTPTDTTDYKTLTAASAGNFVINQATPVLTVTNSPVTYNGSAQSATVSSGAVTGSISNVLYNGLATAPTNAATYAITANFTPTDTTDYATVTGASAGNFVISQATPVLTVTNSPVTYNGSGQTATVSSGAVGGTISSVLYNGSATLPIHPATYAITANFTPTDTTDYKTLTAASAGNFVINQATPVLTVTNSPVTYNGSAQSATVSSGAVGGTISSVLYNGLGTVPTSAATYAITANFTPTDTMDYATVTAASAGNFVIGQATPVLTVTNSPVNYNGSGQTATVSSGAVGGTVSSVLYDGSATLPIHPATYAITANFTPTDTTDYKTLTAASAGNFVISQATPVLSVTNTPVIYNGSAQAATVSSGAVGGTVSNVLYNGLATVPANAATYAITANFTPTDTTDYKTLTAASAGSFVISPATPVLTVTNSPVIYNGSAQAAAVSSGAVSGTVSNVLYSGSANSTDQCSDIRDHGELHVIESELHESDCSLSRQLRHQRGDAGPHGDKYAGDLQREPAGGDGELRRGNRVHLKCSVQRLGDSADQRSDLRHHGELHVDESELHESDGSLGRELRDQPGQLHRQGKH